MIATAETGYYRQHAMTVTDETGYYSKHYVYDSTYNFRLLP